MTIRVEDETGKRCIPWGKEVPRRGALILPADRPMTASIDDPFSPLQKMICTITISDRNAKMKLGCEYTLVSNTLQVLVRVTQLIELVDRGRTNSRPCPAVVRQAETGNKGFVNVELTPSSIARRGIVTSHNDNLSDDKFYGIALQGPHNPLGRCALMISHKLIGFGIVKQMTLEPFEKKK